MYTCKGVHNQHLISIDVRFDLSAAWQANVANAWKKTHPVLVAFASNCYASPGLPFDTSVKTSATLRSGTTATPSKRGIVRRCGFYPPLRGGRGRLKGNYCH
jgi:hypothetical protein